MGTGKVKDYENVDRMTYKPKAPLMRRVKKARTMEGFAHVKRISWHMPIIQGVNWNHRFSHSGKNSLKGRAKSLTLTCQDFNLTLKVHETKEGPLLT